MKYQQSELENLCQTFPNGVLAILVYGPDSGHVNEVAMKISKSTVDDICLLYTSPSPRDVEESRMPSSA